MSRKWKWLLGIAIVLAVPVVAIVAFWFVVFGSCGSNEQAVAMARDLSQQRLGQLFADMQGMSQSNGTSPHFLIFEDGKKVPRAIADLHPRALTLRDGSAIVYLSGCMDDKASLRVLGLDSKRKAEIVLDPGETKDPIVLWAEK
ncbi:MAG: hypothetical protein QM719_03990 [Thermomonas sp.]